MWFSVIITNMDTYNLVGQGLSLIKEGDRERLADYMKRLREDDPLAWAILDTTIDMAKSRLTSAVRKGLRLKQRVSGDMRLSAMLFNILGIAHTKMGELTTAETYHTRALELAEKTGESLGAISAQIYLLYNMLLRADYGSLTRALRESSLKDNPLVKCDFSYLWAILNLISGNPDEALRKLRFVDDPDINRVYWRQGMEVKGLALRMADRLDEALDCLVKVAVDYAEFGDAYASFPCAKALQLARFAGLEPPPEKLIRKCMSLGRKGHWGELAASGEIEALLIEDTGECAKALLGVAQSYKRANQPIEACLAGLSSAFLAWKTASPVFAEVLRFLAPLLPIHPGFRKDSLIGDFAARIEPLLADEKMHDINRGIRAHLIGELRILVNGERLSLKGWRNNKAILALVYLLLFPQHRIPRDHLFYLLWPRRNYDSEANRVLLYKAIYLIKKNLRDPKLLNKYRDFYQLEEVWTDLGEIENLLRLADATRDLAEKEEYLARARELARGELLPEFPYDRHIDEYRQYYKRLRKRLEGD